MSSFSYFPHHSIHIVLLLPSYRRRRIQFFNVKSHMVSFGNDPEIPYAAIDGRRKWTQSVNRDRPPTQPTTRHFMASHLHRRRKCFITVTSAHAHSSSPACDVTQPPPLTSLSPPPSVSIDTATSCVASVVHIVFSTANGAQNSQKPS